MEPLPDMPLVVVVGAGRVGLAVVHRLVQTGCYQVALADPHIRRVPVQPTPQLRLMALDSQQYAEQLRRAMSGAAAVVCATPEFATLEVAAVARELGCHYIDLAEGDPGSRRLCELASGAAAHFVPGCGLAPGLVTTWIAHCAEQYGPQASITAYVGALPQEPLNRLGYANLWGLDGLIAEYTTAARVIRGHEMCELEPLSELECMEVDGRLYEAFNTAGSLDPLLAALSGKVKNLQFKTLRYPGHWQHMQFLLQDMGLRHRPSALKNLLANALPTESPDRLIMGIEVRVDKQRTPVYRQMVQLVSSDAAQGNTVSALSADHVCAVLESLLTTAHTHAHGLLMPHQLGWSVLQRSPFMARFFAALAQSAPTPGDSMAYA